MPEDNRSSISGSRSYEELADYWDHHSLAEHWNETSAVEFEVDMQQKSSIYFPVAKFLAEDLRAAASLYGVSAETLLNIWLQRCVDESRKNEAQPGESRRAG